MSNDAGRVVLTGAEQLAMLVAIDKFSAGRSNYGAVYAAVAAILADRLAAETARADAAEAALGRVRAVHERYFDTDGQPGYDDTTPEPEDVWRFDRDLRAALDAAPDAPEKPQEPRGGPSGSRTGPSATTESADAESPVVHMAPTPIEDLTPCCGRTVFELPRDDRVTAMPERVTCR